MDKAPAAARSERVRKGWVNRRRGLPAVSRYDDPDAWVSGGHEKFEMPVVPIRDAEHPAASSDPFGLLEVNHSAWWCE